MTEIKTMTAGDEIIAMLQQALADKPPRPPQISPERWEQDEYDYDPPGYDPDAEDEDAWEEEGEAVCKATQDETEDKEPEALFEPVTPPAPPMIAAVQQENLKNALDIVVPYVDGYPPLPILANALLETDDGSRLMVSATDLETSITAWIGSKVEVDGAITVGAKTLKELITVLSRERIDFRVDTTDTLHVRCGIQTTELRGIDADEYPPIKHNESEPVVYLAAEALLRMLDATLKCAATEQNRPILTGVYLMVDRGTLTLAGADGFRLGVERLPVDYAGEKQDAVLPGGAVKKLLRVLRKHKGEEVGTTFPDQRNSVTFFLPNILVSTQLLEGRFPDFMRIVPRSCFTQIVLYAEDTLIALKRADIFAGIDLASGERREIHSDTESEHFQAAVSEVERDWLLKSTADGWYAYVPKPSDT